MAIFNIDNFKLRSNNDALYEVVMLGDKYGNPIAGGNPTGTAADAFGRSRVSQPFTLFDSSHRYRDNGSWATKVTGAGEATFVPDEGVVDLTIGSASGDEIIRETLKVFSYQPGKSLQIMTTFAMGEEKENLRQRVGYFGSENGMYLEREGAETYFVERSITSGSTVETRVPQSEWMYDPLDGSGPSGIVLEMDKGHILWMDFEWLGLGTVRMGFVINGEFIHCHSFHHSNIVTTTYITTATLPLRMEMTNIGATVSPSKFKQVCATVISEGGYQLTGLQTAVGTPITTPKALGTAGTFYPVVSLRLKDGFEDAVAIISAASLIGLGNGPVYEWRIVEGSSITTGAWTSGGADSSVEYTTSGTAMTMTSPTRTLASGYTQSTNQSNAGIALSKDALFKFQLSRDSLNGDRRTITLAVTSNTNNTSVYGSMDWEEITR